MAGETLLSICWEANVNPYPKNVIQKGKNVKRVAGKAFFRSNAHRSAGVGVGMVALI